MIKNNKPLKTKKILIVIAPQDFQDQEYGDTRQVLEEQGAKISVGSLKLGDAVGKFGSSARVDILVDDVRVDDFDAVAFIGGQGMVELVGKEEMAKLARQFYEAGKITAAICIAPVILAKVGILTGKKATVWPGAKGELREAGARYTGKPVEIDGTLITGNGPQAATAFGQAIAKALK
jgi:protease I